jgi:hypothetical protein
MSRWLTTTCRKQQPEAPTQRDQVDNNSNMDEQEAPDARSNATMDDP